jgi:hypothetical protein
MSGMEDSQSACAIKNGELASLLTDPNRTSSSLWNRICPNLSIETTNDKKKAGPNPTISSDEAERRRGKLIKDGFALVDEPLDPTLIQKLKEGITRLHEQNLPASLILLFDETWELARSSRKVLASSSHPNNSFNFDLLAWYIEPGESGFSPHRDRQPSDAAATFHPDDDQAKFITNWIALSDATPENSCLYVIPKPHDPGYVDGDTEEEDPLRRALPDKESFQHVRALPRQAGQSIIFTHRIIHWGSKSDPDTPHPPRIAISFVCSDPTYEAPLVSPDCFTEDKTPKFATRLLLVCAQLLIYYQRLELSKDTIKACYEYCKEHESELDENYRHKVFFEFVKAMKETDDETKAQESGGKSEGVKLVVTEEGDDEDEEDAVMEEMLDAEAGGYGEFEDDYDDIEGDDDVEKGSGEGDEASSDEEEEEGLILFGKNQESDDEDCKPPVKKSKIG